MAADLPPETARAFHNLAKALGGQITCLLIPTYDMEAYAARYNRWYAKANPAPLAADGLSYRRRCLARQRRRR